MNKYLRQLFTAVIALFVVLGMSTTIITAIRANSLSSDPRNARALYQEYGAPRGAILASDGTILAQSTPVNDVFSYQRSYTNGPVYAPVTGFFSVTQRGDRGIESSRNKLLSGKADALFWDQLKSLFTGVENKGASIETSINPKLQQLAYQQLGSNDGAAVVIEVKTGRILTLASAPSYDPNALATHDTKKATANYSKLAAQANSPMINRATSQLYPPGSTFKTIVAATALESGDYDTDTQIPAGASYTLPGTSTNLTNTTAAAEFNIYDDPDAAQIVFKSGVPLVMCGLDVTMQAELRPADWDEMAGYGNRCGRLIKELFACAWKTIQTVGLTGVAQHDSCPVMYLAHPELFEGRMAGVFVETQGAVTLGKTVTDLQSDKKFGVQNALVLLHLDREKFMQILKDCIRTLP